MHGDDGPSESTGDKLNGLVTDNINCSVIIIAKDDSNIFAVQFKIKLFDFFLPV